MEDMPAIDTIRILHQRNLALRRAGEKTIGVGAIMRFRREGVPARRPSDSQRTEAIALGMEWDKAAKESRDSLPYRDSSEDVRHQLGENLPTSPNGSNRH